jgi:hypothetical protein
VLVSEQVARAMAGSTGHSSTSATWDSYTRVASRP